ncbi:MAG: LysR family transcriptional regulator [Hoeflea sp.]|uniref:LysR family transcriptional regulator n=1 Tax=Hoeflea sp. TaxID=1940281 RepID=UPI001D9728E4|nr:LysR family transcriptional regulator [Hoeflea sp.]MBU4530026.1 LysR family transcriptional regulator [Alphaproteobacteria bacterium]MBU4542689.1 LysR family transcriptional regulator [Alphaproteobacteria bacterium]MBU4551370.1 LysR family transcriptional regulator [Alphaproteobacteria bacterium]MBV1723193.1 LysR family transcriptional regulator [Hoeflea sp.]MBV1760204.1 LysR family transcriptional regulator [Hoeflea sp.]
MEHQWRNADWNSIRVFLAVARLLSFRKAAEELGISVNTARRTISRLEDQLGYPLLFRESEGARLTDEGRRVVLAARDVESSVSDMWRVAALAEREASGPIRLAITEGLGSFWLTPRIVDYINDTGGQNRIELQCAMRSVDVLRMEADISVQLEKPNRPELKAKRLGYLHLKPFASTSYLEKFGRPKGVADMVNHRVVEQQTDQLRGYELDKIFGPQIADRMVRMKTNFSSAHYWAIAKGAGIGLMPSYARAIGGDVEHIDLGFDFRVEIWLATHPEVAKSARHRGFIDFLTDSFDERKFPWFGPDSLSPEEIEAQFSRQDLKSYFEGFTARP